MPVGRFTDRTDRSEQLECQPVGGSFGFPFDRREWATRIIASEQVRERSHRERSQYGIDAFGGRGRPEPVEHFESRVPESCDREIARSEVVAQEVSEFVGE